MKKFLILLLPLAFLGFSSNTAVAQFCAIQPTATNTCFGLNNGSINLEILGGSNGYTFQWTGPNSFFATTQNIFGLPAGNYCVTVMHQASGCSATACATVGTNPTPTIFSLVGGGAYCEGGAGMPVTLLGSQLGVTYLLYLNGVNISGVPGNGGQIFFGLQTQPGTYFVTATNASGCVTQMTGFATITVNLLPTITAIVSPNAICLGDSATLTTTVNGVVTTMIVAPCQTTNYAPSVTVNGCTATTNTTLFVTDCNPDSDNDGHNDDIDCNDANANVNPGATEVCNGIDDNCNGQTDEGVLNTYYRDADADTYGNPAITQMGCTQPAGYVTNNADCNDNNAAIRPGATEICDGVDNNCNGAIDEGLTFIIYYTDADGDGYGTGTGQSFCTNPGPGFATQAGDCNNNNPAIRPGATELCNGIDDNCNGQIDEGLLPTSGFSSSTGEDGYVYFSINNVTPATTYSWAFGDGNFATGSGVPHTYGQTGTYTVTLTASNLCGTSTTTATISVCVPVELLAETPDQTICSGETIPLQVIVSGGGYFPSGGPNTIQYIPSGNCSNCATYLVTPTVTTTYQWVVNAASACPLTGQITITVDPPCGTTDTDEQGLADATIAYPNPVTADVLYLSNTESNSVVEIFNSVGQIVQKSMYLDGLNVEDLPRGTYFLCLDGKVEAIPFVKLL